MKNNDNFYICLSLSIALHLLAIYIFLFGLPLLSNIYHDEMEEVITFEMLPVAAISNVPTQQKQLEKTIENEQAKEVKQSKPKEEPKQREEPNSKETQERDPPKADAEPIVKEKEIAPKKLEAEKKKPGTLKEEPKKKELKKKLPTNSDLDSLLKNLEASSQGSDTKTSKRAVAQSDNALKESKGSFNPALALTISEQNLIKQQIQRNWNIPLAAQNIEEVAVTLRIELDKDGTVTNVKIVDKVCPNVPGSVCQALANSAERAVWQASPIKNLSLENYNKWKEFNLTFYPKNAL